MNKFLSWPWKSEQIVMHANCKLSEHNGQWSNFVKILELPITGKHVPGSHRWYAQTHAQPGTPKQSMPEAKWNKISKLRRLSLLYPYMSSPHGNHNMIDVKCKIASIRITKCKTIFECGVICYSCTSLRERVQTAHDTMIFIATTPVRKKVKHGPDKCEARTPA